MNIFQKGETVIISCSIMDKEGQAVDPVTSTKIVISDSAGTEKVASTDMTKDATGEYHYDFDTSTMTLMGEYKARITATDGTRKSIYDILFKLEL